MLSTSIAPPRLPVSDQRLAAASDATPAVEGTPWKLASYVNAKGKTVDVMAGSEITALLRFTQSVCPSTLISLIRAIPPTMLRDCQGGLTWPGGYATMSLRKIQECLNHQVHTSL